MEELESLLVKLEPIEFLGVATLLGVKTQGRPFEEILEGIARRWKTMTLHEQKRLLELLKMATEEVTPNES